MSTLRSLSGLFIVMALGSSTFACSSSDDSSGSGGSKATGGAAGSAGSGGSAGSAAGGAAGSSGDSGACKSCAQMVQTAESDLNKACAGTSATLIQAFVQCTCQPDVCGGPGKGCEAACKGGQVDASCVACDQTAAGGTCKSQMDACLADQ